jgi:predicted amidophosphoribosyltransferase
MKIDRTGILAVSAAQALVTHRRTDLESAEADYIVPVPMHRSRRADRGVNSPDIIADELGQRLKIPVVRHLIQRTRPTDLQYTLSRRARAENVADAFALSPPTLWEWLSCRSYLAGTPLRQAIAGKNVLLVDDILTTGSTCNAITKILLAAGVRTVTVAVLARAEGDMYRSR